MKAVGGVVQRLGTRNLISVEKFAEIVTKEIISYQSCNRNPPPEYKKPGEECAAMRTKVTEMTTKITEEFTKMKKNIKEKEDQLID
jgi:hypothetical protein